jgi:phosphoribosylformylglycinamidine (FGAM) synthase-like enzyme
MATIGFKAEGEILAVIGSNYPELGQSLWLREIHGREEGDPPFVDLADEKLNGSIRAPTDRRWCGYGGA